MSTPLIPGSRARVPDHHARRVRHRELRRVPRAAAPRRPADLARRADDDPGGVGEPRDDVAGEARVLPVPLVADGAVGRPGVDRVHRRHRDRRGARPQRPPAEPLLGHRRRPRDHGERGRRRRRRPRARRARRAGCSPGSMFLVDTAQGPHRRRRGDQGRARRRAPVRRVARAGPRAPRRPARPRARRLQPRVGASAARRRSATRTRSSSCSSSPMARTGAEAHRLDGHRHAGRRALRSPAHAVRLLPAAVRAGHEPAARRDPRGAGHVAVVRRSAPRATCSTPQPESCRQIELPFPILDNDELAKLIHINDDGDRPEFAAHVISGLYRVAGGGEALREALDRVRDEASAGDRGGRAHPRALRPRLEPRAGRRSRRCCSRRRCTTTSSARRRARKVGLVVETGDAREVHHMALLIGYGAGAINPYLAFESIEDLIAQGLYGLGGADPHEGDQELHQGGGQGRAEGDVEDGHLHGRVVPRRAGVRGDRPRPRAGRRVLHRHGVAHRRHRPRRDRRGGARAVTCARTPPRPDELAHRDLDLGGEYQWRREGEYHLFNPETVFKLQHATRAKRYDVYKEYTKLVDDQSRGSRRCAGCSPSREGDAARAGADRRGRAGLGDREALRDRRDVVRLDLEGSAREPRHRDEPHRRQVEHRRGRRGRRPLRPRRERRPAPLGDPPGGVRALRRDVGVPRQRRRPPDQDGAGRQARRGRPAARATRCTRGSRRRGTPRPASGSSARRRTTTSTRSRTSSSSSTT